MSIPSFLRLFIGRLIGAAILIGAPLGAAESPPWPHEQSDITPDPAIRWGRLDNGLRYVIRPNALPAGRVYLMLQVDVGSLHERDHQRGYAHFIEHMVFRGTKNHPDNSLTGFLQKEGLAMGADTNAFTNQLSTAYHLDLPKNSPEKISLGLSILRDFSDGAILAQADIHAEAKVIESERLTRESSLTGISHLLGSFIHPGSRFIERFPLGTTDSVRQATTIRLQEFYRTWYRPSFMTVIAVGDADPALLERLIRENFASLAPATPTDPVRLNFSGDQAPAGGIRAAYFSIPSLRNTACIASAVTVQPLGPDNRQRRRQRLHENATNTLLQDRLAASAQYISALFATIDGYEASVDLISGYRRTASLTVETVGSGARWSDGLAVVERTFRTVSEHGFDAAVLQRYIQMEEARLEEAVRNAPNRNSAELALAIRQDLEGNLVTTTPEVMRTIATSVLKNLTVEGCRQTFVSLWPPDNLSIAVVGALPAPVKPEDILTAYGSYGKTYVSKPSERPAAQPVASAKNKPAKSDPAGPISRRSHDDRLDVESVVFANGVRANIKRTDFEKNVVRVHLRFGRGRTTEHPSHSGLGFLPAEHFKYVNSMLTISGGNSSPNLDKNFAAEEDAYVISGRCFSDQLPELLKAFSLYFAELKLESATAESVDLAGYLPRAPDYIASVRKRSSELKNQLRSNPTEYLRTYAPSVVLGQDDRYGPPAIEFSGKENARELDEWISHQAKDARIEIGVAGDIDVDEAVDALARSFGRRAKGSGAVSSGLERRPQLAKFPLRQTWELDGTERTKAAVHVYWPGVDANDPRALQQLEVLAQILDDRLRAKIRNELGATYGPKHGVWGSNTWPGIGFLFVEIETSPNLVDRVAQLIRQTATDLATKGITDEEFSRAIEPILATRPQQFRNNQYWTQHILSQLQEKPKRADWPLTLENEYRSMKRTDVEAAARRFLGGPLVHAFIARPKP